MPDHMDVDPICYNGFANGGAATLKRQASQPQLAQATHNKRLKTSQAAVNFTAQGSIQDAQYAVHQFFSQSQSKWMQIPCYSFTANMQANIVGHEELTSILKRMFNSRGNGRAQRGFIIEEHACWLTSESQVRYLGFEIHQGAHFQNAVKIPAQDGLVRGLFECVQSASGSSQDQKALYWHTHVPDSHSNMVAILENVRPSVTGAQQRFNGLFWVYGTDINASHFNDYYPSLKAQLIGLWKNWSTAQAFQDVIQEVYTPSSRGPRLTHLAYFNSREPGRVELKEVKLGLDGQMRFN